MFLRLDNVDSISQYYPTIFLITILFLIIKMFIFYSMGIYRRYWPHASIDELALLIVSMFIIGFINIVLFKLSKNFSSIPQLPRSLPYLDTLITLIMVGFSRMTIRLVLRYKDRKNHNNAERTLIIGAGQAGISLVGDMQNSPNLVYNPVAFVDDDPKKKGLCIMGIKVVGNHNDIEEVVKKYKINMIIVAIPSASGATIRNILDRCHNTHIPIKTLPSLFEIINGEVHVNNIREININDLLRRNPIKTDCEYIGQYYKGKSVLVTGAGGSIGSELCRQIYKYKPKELLLLGHGENSIFKIQQELLSSLEGDVKITAIIADVKDVPRIENIFRRYSPEIVFHAAAHKHVPLMENNPIEAITNNIYGTNNILNCSEKYKVKKFIMISTDKAVNPSSVMGITKRIAEILVIKKAIKLKLSYSCVRFGNVLGSNGSVVQIFKKQISQGGPVTVTHPEVKRFFMTIPEAVQLVLYASYIGTVGELFVLNMENPIKIIDLAKDMIRLSGLKENEINIQYTGLRPGEKLFEELFLPGEKCTLTDQQKIFVVSNHELLLSDKVDQLLGTFREKIYERDVDSILTILREVIEEYN